MAEVQDALERVDTAWQVKRSGGSVVCPVCPAGDHTRKQFLAVGQ
jgi:hypothetical protein